MLPSEVRYLHRVGPLHWLFESGGDDVLEAIRTFHLQYDADSRSFEAQERRPPVPVAGWLTELLLSDAEADRLRSLLPPEELAICMAASLGADHADDA